MSQFKPQGSQILYSSNELLKYSLWPKELEVISRYLEVIPLSTHETAETSQKVKK